MTAAAPWANWLMGMNDKMIGPQFRGPQGQAPAAPGVRYTGAPKPQAPVPQQPGPNLRAPQTGKGFQQLNRPTPNWGVGGAGTPLPPFNPYDPGFA